MKASELLLKSADPFDQACVKVREIEEQNEKLIEQLRCINEILSEGYYSESFEYDFQSVQVAHRIAAGIQPPKKVTLLLKEGEPK